MARAYNMTRRARRDDGVSSAQWARLHPEEARTSGNHRLSADKVAMIERLLLDGFGTRPTATQVGCAHHTVTRYRGIMLAERPGLLCGCGAPMGHQGWCKLRYSRSDLRQAYHAARSALAARNRAAARGKGHHILLNYPFISTASPKEDHALLLAINALVPKNLPEEKRADICQDMIVAVLSGEIAQDNFERDVAKFIAKSYRDHPTKFGDLSLDAPIKGTEDLRLGDTLTDGIVPQDETLIGEALLIAKRMSGAHRNALRLRLDGLTLFEVAHELRLAPEEVAFLLEEVWEGMHERESRYVSSLHAISTAQRGGFKADASLVTPWWLQESEVPG